MDMNILFIIVGAIGLLVLFKYIWSDSYTLHKYQDATLQTVVPASSLASNGTNVPQTNFAYSVWIYINDWNYRYGESKTIFERKTELNKPCPNVSLDPIENNLTITLTCFPGNGTDVSNTVIHMCKVTNIMVQKWVNITISVYNKVLDVYLDGKLVKTNMLPGIVNNVNGGDVVITPRGGFNGYTAKLQYYPNPLNPNEALHIYNKGYSPWAQLYNSYQFKVAILENGKEQHSTTI